MKRKVVNVSEFLTVGELRNFLASEEGMKLNENAFIWIPTDTSNEWEIDCATDFSVDRVSTPEDGYPQELALCISAKRMRNKAP